MRELNEEYGNLSNEKTEVLGEDNDTVAGLEDRSEKSGRNKWWLIKKTVEKGKIMTTWPKSKGKYSHWLNIIPKEENKDPVCANWDLVKRWKGAIQETAGHEHAGLLIAVQE
ncbi:Hypothetical predicted protein [Octopus vulgaris]|uniref:Uncharacterized protein n=1 Tax=Octopus vulgaris TaxID=6645 RepID=A0AA36AWD4_OCTVU|nr:Hypothetical predicted protein [Octopus vulgaris]